MSRIRYRPINFRGATLGIIETANAIIADYESQGFNLTLRQLYYQFIARDAFPESWIDKAYNKRNGLAEDTKNTEKNYDRLGSIITDARYGGLVSWTSVVDRTRGHNANSHWNTPADIIKSAMYSFALDKWEGQDHYVEVWIEKDALKGVIAPVCEKLDITYLSCRGYTSASEMWMSAMRMKRQAEAGRKPVVLHLGDHDPSGVDMSRDITDRINEFMVRHNLDFERLALNMDQVEKYNPPPNPAKLSDSRARAYIEQYGRESWELDALEPRQMAQLIERAVKKLRNKKLWDARVEEEGIMRRQLEQLSDRWDDAVIVLQNEGVLDD